MKKNPRALRARKALRMMVHDLRVYRRKRLWHVSVNGFETTYLNFANAWAQVAPHIMEAQTDDLDDEKRAELDNMLNELPLGEPLYMTKSPMTFIEALDFVEKLRSLTRAPARV